MTETQDVAQSIGHVANTVIWMFSLGNLLGAHRQAMIHAARARVEKEKPGEVRRPSKLLSRHGHVEA